MSSNLNREVHFPTTYDAIVERINNINPIKYASTRNYLNGKITYLSPYISRGVISLPQIVKTILDKGYPLKSCEKLIQELAWREYFQRVWQEKNKAICTDLKNHQENVAHFNMISSILNATTGINIIDDQINKLYSSSYLHNHIRMYLASLVCNIGKAHWQIPSKWMYFHLLDGDLASNNCSWQWVAGTFSNKKYYCNQENINKYTFTTQTNTFLDNSYDTLVSMSIPLALEKNEELALDIYLPQTDFPIIDITKPTLIYNSYNIDPNWRKEENVNRLLLLEPSHFSNYPVSKNVINFLISLSKNIEGIQVFVGEIKDLEKVYVNLDLNNYLISKEHPFFTHYPGIKDPREWLFPNVNEYYPSFFSYWKRCEKSLQFLL
jgi:deoxyribodipyrimidine photo-lyase